MANTANTPRPSSPTYRELIPEARGANQMICMLANYVNHPSLLAVTPSGELWSSPSSTYIDGWTGAFTEHFSQTFLPTDPVYQEVFKKPGFDRIPHVDHVEFTIGTRILDRPEGRSHEIVLFAKALDVNDEIVKLGDGYFGDYYFDAGGWPCTPARAVMLLPILKDIFGDWKCIVEYLKYKMESLWHDEDPNWYLPHPLIHMGILGDGMTLRRASVRCAGTIVTGFDPTRNGLIFEDNRVWQELRNGIWEDI